MCTFRTNYVERHFKYETIEEFGVIFFNTKNKKGFLYLEHRVQIYYFIQIARPKSRTTLARDTLMTTGCIFN
jgi:hypothetical protein